MNYERITKIYGHRVTYNVARLVNFDEKYTLHLKEAEPYWTMVKPSTSWKHNVKVVRWQWRLKGQGWASIGYFYSKCDVTTSTMYSFLQIMTSSTRSVLVFGSPWMIKYFNGEVVLQSVLKIAHVVTTKKFYNHYHTCVI